EVFDARLGARPNQLDRLRDDVRVSADQLLDIAATPGSVTIGGVRGNISVGVRYIASWLGGTGAAAIDNLMEDAATAEICRSQVWQWLHHGRITGDDLRRTVHDVSAELGPDYDAARALFEQVATGDPMVECLTIPAYEQLEG